MARGVGERSLQEEKQACSQCVWDLEVFLEFIGVDWSFLVLEEDFLVLEDRLVLFDVGGMRIVV